MMFFTRFNNGFYLFNTSNISRIDTNFINS